MVDAHKNFAYSTVATAPSPASSGTSLVVAAADGTKFPAVPFNATVWPASTQPTTANAEIVRVTAISTDTLTITRTQESTSARTIVVGDQIAATITAKTLTDIETPAFVLPTGAIAQTGDRNLTQSNTGLISSGRLSVAAIKLPPNQVITSITWESGTQALVTGSNQWFALFDSARNKLQVTSDDTNVAWAANTTKTLNLASPYTTTTAGLFYIGLLVVATTVPSQLTFALGSGTGIHTLAPVTVGSCDTGLTNPASCPATFSNFPTSSSVMPYGYVS